MSTKFWEKYILSSHDVIQLLKQKSDILIYDYSFHEFFLGKLIVKNKPTKRLIKTKNTGTEVLWHVVNIKSI